MEADLLITGARVWSGGAGGSNGSGGEGGICIDEPVGAVAVRRGVGGGRIEYVGPMAGAARFVGSKTEKVDAGGKWVLPGFIDCHLHLMWFGKVLTRQADLTGCGSVEEIIERLRVLERRLKESGEKDGGELVLIGHGFDQDKLAGKEFPKLRDLDAAFGNVGVLITRVCGHAAVVNSAMLARVSEAQRAAGDAASGLYTEDAIGPFFRSVPQLSDEQMGQAILAASKVATEAGFTGVNTLLDTADQMRGYTRLAALGKLPIRVVAMPPWGAMHALADLGLRSGFGDERLRFGACKLFSDGSLGARTALLSEPYADATGGEKHPLGQRIYEPGDLIRRAEEAARRGWAVAIHAIGDAAMHESVDALEAAKKAGEEAGYGDLRHRIEHASVVRPETLERMVRMRLMTTVQPQFVTSDTWSGKRLGQRRLPWAYAFATMAKMGLPLGLSSDCPVEKLSAMECLASATGGAEWRPGETLTAEQALNAYTYGSARAGGTETSVGRLGVGMCADMVMLEGAGGDLLKLKGEDFKKVKVAGVWVGGERV